MNLPCCRPVTVRSLKLAQWEPEMICHYFMVTYTTALPTLAEIGAVLPVPEQEI